MNEIEIRAIKMLVKLYEEMLTTIQDENRKMKRVYGEKVEPVEGAGMKDLQRPNLLRVTIGETESNALWSSDNCIEIKIIMDDMDARIWPDTAYSILETGAFDCYATMCTGRKGRPAMEVTVLCPIPRKDDIIECIFRNTSTLGMRFSTVERAVLDRDFSTVETKFGPIRMKRAFLDGKLLRTEPEYEDCVKASRQHNIPVQEIITTARCATLETERDG